TRRARNMPASARPAEAPDMAADALSILVAGDSHVMGYRPQTYEIDLNGRGTIPALLSAAWLGGGSFALDAVVTFADGRVALNPLLDQALGQWPGHDRKGVPTVSGRIEKHLVLS